MPPASSSARSARSAPGARPTGSRRRRRWLPRTGPGARWPIRAHRAGQIAVLTVVFLLIFGFVLARRSAAGYLRLVEIYRSLPATVVAVVLVSGVIYFALDSLRLVLTRLIGPADRRRRPLLLSTVATWLLLTIGAAISMIWYPASVLFGSTA